MASALDLSALIRALMGAVAGWRGVLGVALVLVLHRRLSGIGARMERLAARYAAGRTLRRDAAGAAGVRREDRPDHVRVWPFGFGWLVRLMGYRAAGYGSQLQAVLTRPEMAALLRAAPQAARILRPLCRMLAVDGAVLRQAATAGRDAKGVAAAAAVVAGALATPAPGVSGRAEWGRRRRVALPRGVLAAVRRGRLRNGG